jgi:hypothetical protein
MGESSIHSKNPRIPDNDKSENALGKRPLEGMGSFSEARLFFRLVHLPAKPVLAILNRQPFQTNL